MVEFLEKPSPNLTITDANANQLPLSCFNLVIIVEPDPALYTPRPTEIENLHFLLSQIETAIVEETSKNRHDGGSVNPQNIEEEEVNFVWVHFTGSELPYYRNIVKRIVQKRGSPSISCNNWNSLRCHLRKTTTLHPNWRAALFGAMLEDDVIRIANLAEDVGLPATVLTRYSISLITFAQLEDLFLYDSWVIPPPPTEDGRDLTEPAVIPGDTDGKVMRICDG